MMPNTFVRGFFGLYTSLFAADQSNTPKIPIDIGFLEHYSNTHNGIPQVTSLAIL